MGHLLNSIDDPNEYGSLAMVMDQLSYRQPLDKAVKLRAMKAGHQRSFEHTRTYPPNPKCYTCGQTGHTARYCATGNGGIGTNPPRIQQGIHTVMIEDSPCVPAVTAHKSPAHKPQTSTGNTKGVQLTVPLSIYGVEVECLIDSGSQINLIEQQCFNRIKAACRDHRKSRLTRQPTHRALRERYTH